MNNYQQVIHITRYARWSDEKNRRETWEETVDRYIDFMCHKQCKGKLTAAEVMELRDAIVNLEVMPSMRCMMTAGEALRRDNAAGFNCTGLIIDSIESFDEMMYLLMCGCGVGFSVERQFITKLPEVPAKIKPSDKTIKVRDSRKGWAEALREYITALYAGIIPQVDTSDVRPVGARLKTFGGRASGPEPLIDLFNFLTRKFKGAAGRKLTSIDCHDICCMIAEVVVAGGTRRSATISLSNLSDDRMRDAKAGQWWETAPWRAMANNSAAYTEKPGMRVWFKEWQALYDSMSGERGVFNRDAAKRHVIKRGRRDPNYDFVINPCVTADTNILVDKELPQGYGQENKLVSELIGKPFIAVVHNQRYLCRTGFFYTGTKDVFKLTAAYGSESLQLRATADHKISVYRKKTGVEDVELSKLRKGDLVVLTEPCEVKTNPSKPYETSLEYIKWCPDKHTAKVVSIVADGKEDVYDCTIDGLHHYVANGIVVHNCGEIILRPSQMCNLSEVVVRESDTVEDLERKVRLATLLGTMQATLTDFQYLRDEWKKNVEEEALLGVSLSGVMDHPLMSGKMGRKVLNNTLAILRDHAIECNKRYAKVLGVNEATAVTTVKPSGCRPWYALTTTDKGILTLEELMAQHVVGTEWSDVKDVKALQGEESTDITKTYDNGVKPITRIKLSYGMELDCTDNHQWWVTGRDTPDGLEKVDDWVHTEQLKLGDIIEVIPGTYTNSTSAKTLQIIKEEGKSPAYMDTQLAWLLGYLWGSGARSGHFSQFCVTGNSEHNLQMVKSIVEDKFGEVNGVLMPDWDDMTSGLYAFNCPALYRWCMLNNTFPRNSSGLLNLIPRVVRQSSRDDIVAFIAGMVDAGGWAGCGITGMFEVRLPIKSKAFSNHLQHVAWAVGIAVSRTEIDKDSYCMELTGHVDRDAFKVFANNCRRVKDLYWGTPYSPELFLATHDSDVPPPPAGKVVGVTHVGDRNTYDIETGNHWYYAGAVKSHNTVSQLVNCASGLHPRWSPYYIRTIRGSIYDPVSKLMMDAGVPYEASYLKPKTEVVFSFPQKSPDGAVSVDTMSAIEQLELWRSYKEHWCEHQPSITVYVREHEWMEVGAWVYKYFDIAGGLSFLPATDHIYQQAPYQTITAEEYEEAMKHMPKSIDWSALSRYEKDDAAVTATRELACSGDSCEIVDIPGTNNGKE